MISKRAKPFTGDAPPIVKAHFLCSNDPFDKKSNPNGYINLGTAENFLMDQEIVKKFKAIGEKISFSHHYDFPQGGLNLRESYNNFQKRFLNIQKMPVDNIVFASGASAILEMLTYSLCEDNDKIAIISPFYNGFYHDIEARFKGELIPINCLNEKGIDLNVFKKELQESEAKIILINNPHNPTGHCMLQAEIESIISICKGMNVEIIADEIYAKSVYTSQGFVSFLDPAFDKLDYKDRIHHVYGMAKDFCMSGLKVGVFSSHNTTLVKSMASLAYFHTISTQTQAFAEKIFSDAKWCEKHFEKNNERLYSLSEKIRNFFSDTKVLIYPSASGIFLWMDFSKALNIKNFQDEEIIFSKILSEYKINLSPGKPFASVNPGFFRMCFAKDQALVDEALLRLKKLLVS